MPDYDLFVSYAHRDNHDGWIEAFVASIQEEHARFTPTPLRIFLDLEGIRTMDDWEHRILAALRSSKVMLALLSPAYFESAYCRKEWEAFLDHELDRAMVSQGIASVYAATVPGFEDEAQAALDPWLANLRRRQYLDLRPWRPEGPSSLRADDVRRRLELLDQRVAERLQAAETVSSSPSTVPPHNRSFVGRVDEIRRIREALALGRVGTMVAVQGLGGIGKSALAFEYAHAFAEEYPGGRFLISCAGVDDLRVPLVGLAEMKGVSLTDDERKNTDSAFARVRAAFESGPRSLLVLDNVEEPALLSPHQRSRWLPATDRVHVLITTRLEAGRLPGLALVPIESLPEADAVRLLERYRPFDDDDERDAAAGIARRLGGYPLAVEVVAVYLWQTPEVSYQGYLARLGREGLEALEGTGRDDRVALSRHSETLLTELLEPTLARLSGPEILALEYAALLPPDRIALPWLRSLTGARFPEAAAEAEPGYPDPWRQIERRLMGLHLLTAGEDPRLARMHRLAQEVVVARLDPADLQERKSALDEHARSRGEFIQEAWTDAANHWEIDPLGDYALLLLEREDPAWSDLANLAAEPMWEIGRYAAARELHRRAVAICEKVLPDSPSLAESCCNLGLIEWALGHLDESRDLLHRAIGIEERVLGPDAPSLAIRYANLALVEGAAGHHEAARELHRRAIAIEEQALGSGHPNLAAHYSNLGMVEQALGNLETARGLLQRAIAIEEQALGNGHPNLAIRYSNLGMIEQALGDLEAAHDLLHRALAIWEKTLPPEHPNLAAGYSNLGTVERDLGNLETARDLLHRALAIDEKAFGPEHPNLAIRYANLGTVEQALGNLEAARDLLRRALAHDEKGFGPDHPDVAITRSYLGDVERQLGHLEEAWGLLDRAIAVLSQAFDPEHPRLAGALHRMALVEHDRGNAPEARDLMRRAHRAQHKRLGPRHPETLKTARWLAHHDLEAPAHEDAGEPSTSR